MIGRVAFLRTDGVFEIRLINRVQDKIDLKLQWPDGSLGIFIGYTLNGFLKYKEIE